MKISVILAFLLSWSSVSSNPRRETLNDKGVGESNHENDGGSDSSNLARTESSDASSGKDWGGDILNFLSQTDLDGTDKNDDKDGEAFLLALISEGQKVGAEFVYKIIGGIKEMIGASISSSDTPSDDQDLSDNNHDENILSWIGDHIEALIKYLASRNRGAEESTSSVDEETKRHGNRAKRDLGISWSNPYKDSISDHLLKLSEGSTSNVLRSEKATVAEALNGRAAIRKILERAKANAAKIATRKDLYDTNDFGKWLLSGSFDTNIFHHPPRRPTSQDMEEHSDAENTDEPRHRAFSTLHDHVFDPTNRHRHHHHRRHREGKHAFSVLSDPTAVDTEHSYATLLPKSKYRHFSPKLQIASEEQRSRDETDGTFRGPTAGSRQKYRSSYDLLSYEDDLKNDIGPQYYWHAYAPHIFRITEDEDAENSVPRWKWIRRFGPRSADSLEFDSGEEMDDYKKKYIFRSTLGGFGDEEEDDGEARAGRQEGHRISSRMDIYDGINRDGSSDEETKLTTSNSHGGTTWRDVLGRERYYYGIGDREPSVYDGEADAIAFGGAEDRRLADFLAERASSRLEKNIRNKNKHLDHDAVEDPAIYSTTTGKTARKRSGNALTTKISTPTWEAGDIDMEYYRSIDRNVDAATSLWSGLSDEEGSERTNNALMSVDDGSVRREAVKSGGHGVLGTRPVIDNDAAAAEIEVGFSGIKSHPQADPLPWTHSSSARVRSETHLGNQEAHRGIAGYGRAAAVASTETEQSTGAPLERAKTRKNWPAGEYENYADFDPAEKNAEEVNGDAESSTEAASPAGSEHRYDLLRSASSSGDSREEERTASRKQHVDLNGGHRTGRHGTSIDMIDSPDRSGEREAYILIPGFPAYKFRRGRWPYDVNYYVSEETRDDQEIEVGGSGGNSREGEINYDDWEREEEFSPDDEEKSIMAVSNARGSNDRRSQRRKHVWRDRYDRHAFNEFLRNITWSSSIMSSISEYEVWQRYVEYLYYLWRQAGGKSDASFEDSTLATEESEEQDNAMDEEILLDRHGGKHTTDEDNYIHLRKHKKWPERAGKLITNASGFEQDKIKSINNERTSNEDHEEGEAMSEGNVNNRREDHEALTHTGNVIREDSTADVMLRADSNRRIIDNNRYRQRNLWNSLSLKNSYADARIKSSDYDPRERNKNVDRNQATETSDSKNNLQRMSKTSSTSRYAESQMDEHDKSQMKRMHYLRGKSRIKGKNSAEILTETASSTDKSQSNVRDAAAGSKLSQDEYYLKNSEDDKKHSTSAEASANAISMRNRQESENTSSFSKSSVQSETERENYSKENGRRVRISAINSGASSESFAKSGTKTERTRNNSQDVQINANAKASSGATFSNNARNEWSTSSSGLSAESRLKPEHSTDNKDSRISATSRSSAGSTLSGTAGDERRSHLQRSSSSSSATSSGKLQTESQYDSNSMQNSQMNVAESSAASTSLSNAGSVHWIDSSKSSASESLKEARQHNSSDVIKIQKSNTEDRSELESTSSSKSRVESKLKNKYYLSVLEGNENNVVEASASSETTTSASIKNNHQQEWKSSTSYSLAESQVENRNRKNRKEISISNMISRNVVNEMEQRNLLRALSSSQVTSKDDLKVREKDPQTVSKPTTLETSTETNGDRQKDKTKIAWFIDPRNNWKTSKNNEMVGKGEIAKENSNPVLNAATTATTSVASTDIRNTQNSITTSSSTDSKVETRIYSENQLKGSEAMTGNSAVPRIPATSGTSSEIGDNHKNKLLRTSSESRNTSTKEERRDMDTTQSSQESMAAAKTSSESTVSSNNVRNESTEESTLFAFPEEARQKQRNLDIRGKSKDTASEEALMTSNNVNDEYQNGVLKGVSSVISHKKLQTEDKLRDKNEAGAGDSVEMSESAIIRNNKKHERSKHISSYDYRDEERVVSETNSGGSIKYLKNTGDVNEVISTGSIISTVSSDRDNLLKVTSSNNLNTKSSRENEDKSDIHSGADGTASTGITSYDDKQARGNILRKLIFLSDPSDEAQITRGDIPKGLPTVYGNKEFKEDNLRQMLPSDGLRVRNENVESTASANENIKAATDSSTSMDRANVNFKSQDNPSIVNVSDEDQRESTSSIGAKAQSEINHKSSVLGENEVINTKTRDMYNNNKSRTKYQTATSSSSHAETQDKSENTLKTEASMTNEIENSDEDASIRGKSSSISSGFRNYGEHRTKDMEDATKVKASAKTSIPNVSPIECQDDATEEASAMSQLKRHDLNVRDEDKEIASDVLQLPEEITFNGMRNTQQRQLLGSIVTSNSRTEKQQHGEIGDIAREGSEVTASVATSASSATIESESREKLMGVSSESDSYTKSQKGSRHDLNAVSREEQIIASTKAVSDNPESVRQSDRLKKDSLADPSRNTYAKIENEHILESNLASIADATSSTRETSQGVIKDERQSGVTRTVLLSNSRAEAQEWRDYDSSVQRESIETSSGDTKDRVLRTENVVNSVEANLKAAANTTSADAILSSVQDSSGILSSVNSHAESRMDNTRTQMMAPSEFRNVEEDKSLQATSSSDAYVNAQATGKNTNSVEEDLSVVNARTETATYTDIKDGLSDLPNAENGGGTANAKASASIDAGGKHTDNLMREKSNVDPQIQGMTKTENDNNTLQEDLRNSENAEAAERAASDLKNELREKDEHESGALQEQRLITVDSMASSISKTPDHAVQKNNLKELVATSSNSYEKSNVENENRVLAKDRMDVLGASTSTTTSNEFRNVEGGKSLQTTSDVNANAQTVGENSKVAGKDSNAAANARTESSGDIKGTDSHGLLDLLSGAAVTRMRTEGEAISRESAIREDLSETSPNVFLEAGVESAKIPGGNYENSAAVNAIGETGSGDRRDQREYSRGTASETSDGTRDSRSDITKSTSSANSYAAARTMSEGSIAEKDPEVNISTLEAAEAHNQVKGAHPAGWLVTTSDAGTVAEGRAQNKDKFNVLRGVEKVAVYAAEAGNIEDEQRDARAKERGEHQGGSNVATKIRHAATESTEVANKSGSESVSSNKTTKSSNEAPHEKDAQIRTKGKSDVSRNAKQSSINIEETQSSTTSAASSASASTSDGLSASHAARYHHIGNRISAIVPASQGMRLSSGETAILHPSREISQCDEDVKTREFISEATSLYQILTKQPGSEILLMKKNPRGPVQIASLKNSMPPLITYRLIPREVYERIRAIIANKQIFCADCALSSALKARATV